MATQAPDHGWRPQTIIRLHYFVYFGLLGIYLPYFNLYCYHLGLSGMQIGVLNAVRSVTMVVFPLLWGALADRYRARKSIFIFCSGLSALLWSGYLVRVDFTGMLVITAAYGVFFSPLISFLEAFTMDYLGRRRQRYGSVRVWGSISFIATVLCLGPLVDRYSLALIVTLILAGSLLMFVLSAGLVGIRREAARGMGEGCRALIRPRVVGFLLGAFLMLVSHGTYYGFFSIHLEQLGFDRTFIGACWALASTAEISVMLGASWFLRHVRVERVLVWSFPIAALRWGITAFVTDAPAILAVQLLHAVTYGAFHVASILYMDRLAPSPVKTMGQAINNAVTYGLGLMVGFFLSGWGFAPLGTRYLFVLSAVGALLGGLLMGLIVSRPDNSGGSGGTLPARG
jgi:PPP family 3-phenylpropionic acid transporter